MACLHTFQSPCVHCRTSSELRFGAQSFSAQEPSDLHLSWGGKIRSSDQCLQNRGGLSGKLLEASNPALLIRIKGHTLLGSTPTHPLGDPISVWLGEHQGTASLL